MSTRLCKMTKPHKAPWSNSKDPAGFLVLNPVLDNQWTGVQQRLASLGVQMNLQSDLECCPGSV